MYEPNDRGGAELHLGSHQPLPSPVRFVRLEEEPRWRTKLPRPLPTRFESNQLLDEFFGQSAWRRIGYWTPGIHDAKAACENLLDELLAFTTPDVPM